METDALTKLIKFLTECRNANIDPFQIFTNLNYLHKKSNKSNWQKCRIFIFVLIIGCSWYALPYVNQGECLFEMPSNLNKIFRPPEKCDFCRGITKVDRISKITPDDFEDKYAYSGRPVIITDATQNWTALQVFNFDFFKNIYTSNIDNAFDCQFFPYKSGFRNLLDAFSIPLERVNFEPGTDSWYFGWSNCHSDITEILRKYYGKPYFLPKLSESPSTDWIFMGGSGLGAHMHIDNVRLPSWQAQLKGSKEWILAPPPECYFECNSFRTFVKTGEIIVLDTNKWYHQTNVILGELSITIGAEYD